MPYCVRVYLEYAKLQQKLVPTSISICFHKNLDFSDQRIMEQPEIILVCYSRQWTFFYQVSDEPCDLPKVLECYIAKCN